VPKNERSGEAREKRQERRGHRGKRGVEVIEVVNFKSEFETPYSSHSGSTSLVSNIVYLGRAY
jgi:hypothetical protein